MNFYQNFHEHSSENSYFPGINHNIFEDTNRASNHIPIFPQTRFVWSAYRHVGYV